MNQSIQNLRTAARAYKRRTGRLLFFLVAFVTGLMRGIFRFQHERTSGGGFGFARTAACVALLSLLAVADANASHLRYMNLTWSRPNSSTRTVTFTFNHVIAGSSSVGTSVGSYTFTTSDGGTFTMPISVTSENTTEGWYAVSGTATYTFPGTATDFTVSYNNCCRISTTVNNANDAMNTVTEVKLVAGNLGSPVSTLPPVVNVSAGGPVTFNVPATDPDGSALTYSLAVTSEYGGSNQPSGFSVNAATGVASFNTSSFATNSLHNAAVKITDATGSTTIVDFLMKVVPFSNPPIYDYAITPANGVSYTRSPGQPLTFSLSASDADAGSSVLLSAVGLPSGVTFTTSSTPGNPATATFSWTPGVNQLGTFVFSFIATDNIGTQTTTIVNVTVNTNPVFVSPTPTIDRFIASGTTLSDIIKAQNPDNTVNTQLFSASMPAGATITPAVPGAFGATAQATVNWVTSTASFGDHQFSFVAKDPSNNSGNTSYRVVVNTAPVFTSNPVLTAAPCQPYVYNITGTDADIPYGDFLEFEPHNTLPAWLTLTNTGSGQATLSGTPPAGTTGSFVIELVAADSFHHQYTHVEQAFTITVAAPNVTVTNGGNVCTGTNAVFTINGPASNVVTYNINNNTNTTVTPNGSGVATVTLSNTTGPQTLNLVSVTNTTTNCTQTISGSSTVTINPVPTGSASPQTICSGSTTSVALNSSISGGTYTWTAALQSGSVTGFANCTSSCGNTIAQALTNTGTGSGVVRYTVTPISPATCPGTPFTVDVTVNAQPVANAGPDKIICGTGDALQANAAVAPQAGAWSIISGTSTSASQFSSLNDAAAVFSPAVNPGTYTLKWTLSNAPCTASSDTVVITTLGSVQGTITASSNANVCSGQTSNINISVNPVSGGTFSGTFTNGKTFTNLAPAAGIISPSYTFTNNGITNTTESFVLSSLVFTPNTSTQPTPAVCNATAQAMGGQTLVTIQPVSDIAAVVNGGSSKCNGTAVVIDVTNPNSVGGTYNRTAVYNGVAHTGPANGAGQSFNTNATFTETLTNNTSAPVNVVYTFTPVSPGSQGCVGLAQSVTVTVNPSPNVVAPANQLLCNNAATNAVTFSGSVTGTTFAWTNDNANIGLAASGTGPIAGFTAVNTGTTNVVANINVVPSANGCTGTAQNFTITVKPTPTVVDPADQTLCNGSATAAVTLTGAVSGTVFNWTNDHTSTGLAASGTATIPSFNAANSTAAPVISTVVITPVANGCTGAAEQMAITVNPTPVVDVIANDVKCNGAATTAVQFTGAVSGTTYTWNSDNTTIGIAASGNGDIASFTATNNGTTPVVATVTVTPHANSCNGTPRTFTITVNPTPTVASVNNQTVCNGANTSAVSFTGDVANTAFNWSNTNNTIGLASSGTGNIAAFAGTNTGATVASGTITVTPVANSCTGTATNFSVTVNPTPVVNNVTNQVVCNNAATTAVAFTGAVANTVYNWTNTQSGIGLAASGTGDIATFNAVNSGTTPVVATIEVTPVANNCTGTAGSFTITVNPTPTVVDPADQVVCNGSAAAAVTFAGAVSNTTYNWTNDNTSIGLAASGSANIATFTAVNNGTIDAVAHIQVTPVANGCTGAAETFTVTVHPSPAFAFSVNGSTVAQNDTATICQAAPTTFAVSGATANSTFTMTHNGNAYASGAVNGAGTFTHSFVSGGTPSNSTAGTYVLSVTDAVTGCVAAHTYTINVNPKPTDTFKVNGVALVDGQTSTHCEGDAIQFALAGSSTHSYVISKGASQIASGTVNSSVNIPAAAVADAGTYTVVLTDDNTGCTATRSYQIVVNPLPVYSFIVNSNTLANADTTTHCSGTAVAVAVTGDNGATYTLSHNGTPVTSGSVNGTAYNFTAATGDAGAYLLTVTSSLGCVRSSTYNMNINVAPAFTAVPANATANTATGTCSNAVTYTAATASATPAAAMTYVLTGATTGNGNGDASGHIFNKGVTQVTLTATNVCGTKDSTFTVTVNDNEQPVFTSCPATVNAYAANSSCGNTVVTTNPAYTDNCTLGATPLTWTMSGATTANGTGNIGSHVFNTGTTAVAYTVTDASGNTAVCNYSVVVLDTVRPVINCVANITRNTDANICGAVVTYNAPTSSDNCAIATTVQTAGLASGATFPRGTTVNTFVVTDASGNTATCSFNVTVNDAQGPAITPPAAQTLNVGSGTNCQVIMPDYRSLFTIVDNCSGTLTIEQLAPNQPGSLVIGYGGTRTVKVKATDVAGNISIDSFTLNLVDATAPTAICKNIVIDLNASGAATITPSMINNGSLDNCSAITLSASKLSFDCTNVGANTVVLTATDASGNSATCNATVTVHDITAPVVSCWGDTTLLKGAQCTTEIPDMTYRVNATDACGVASVTQSPVAGTIIGAFTQTFPITLTVTDVNGNASNCSFNVNFADHTKPTFVNFPANIVINNGQDSCGKKVTWTAPIAFDNCNVLGAASLSTTHASGTIFPLGTTTVTYTAIDQAGNDSVRSFTVTVVDAQAPVIAGCPANVLVNTGAGATSCDATASWTEPTATDNCTPSGNLVWTKSHQPGTVFPLGTTTVSYTATDASGNVSNTCSFNVIVTDNTLPVLAACPADITVYTGTGATTCGMTATWTEPTATDNCTPSGNLVWTKNHIPGDVFTTGTTTVTYTATDVSGNASATCSFNVTVIDNTAPVLSACPATVTVNTGANAANCEAIATWNEPTVTDNCSSGNAITWTKSHTPGSVFSVGTTTVTYTATDAAGNTSATCSFNVVVTDNTAPVLAGCPATVQVNTGAGATSCGAVATWTEPTATDNCTPTANLVWTKSHTPGAVFQVGSTTVTYTATDASGNVSATCSFNVVVTDNTAPVFTSCPSAITNAPTNAAGCNGNVTTVNPVVTDNCNLDKLTWTLSGATSGTSASTGINYLGQHIFAPGTTTVTYTATDAAGNTNICSYTVTVVNTLVGNIGGTSTVSQNVGTTSNVVFVTQGGNNSGPYTFTYTMNGGAPQTVTTTGNSAVVTIPQSNAVLGTYTYALLSVTNANGCSAAINPVNDTAVITVIPYVPLADLNISLDFNAVSFNPSISMRPFNAYVSNFGAADANGVVTVRLTRPSSAFTYSLDASSAAGWTLTPGTTSYTLTSNSAITVAAGDFQVINLKLNKTGVAAVGTTSVNGVVFPATGEANTTNNSSSVNVNVSQ